MLFLDYNIFNKCVMSAVKILGIIFAYPNSVGNDQRNSILIETNLFEIGLV